MSSLVTKPFKLYLMDHKQYGKKNKKIKNHFTISVVIIFAVVDINYNAIFFSYKSLNDKMIDN